MSSFLSKCVLKSILFSVHRYAYIDGTAQHGSSLHSFLEDVEEVSRRFLRLVHLPHATREVLHGLHGAAPFQSFVTAVQPVKHEQDSGFLFDQNEIGKYGRS